MKKFTFLFEAYTHKMCVQNISSKDEFSSYVHEVLFSRADYNEIRADMIVEQLSAQYPENWQAAAKELENFQ